MCVCVCDNFIIVNSFRLSYVIIYLLMQLAEKKKTDKLGFLQLTKERSDIELNSYFHYLDGRTGPGPSSQEEGLFDRLSLTTQMSG